MSNPADLDWGIFIIMEEIWKDVKDYEGYYQVSNLGRVRGLDRVATRDKAIVDIKGIVLKQFNGNRGARRVTLFRNGKRKKYFVHQLMAIAFLNHTPSASGLVVNHIDGNPVNNTIFNLEIVTIRDNSTTCFRRDKHTFSSKYVGVSTYGKKWKSRIYIGGKPKYLGVFNTEIEALNAYQKALLTI